MPRMQDAEIRINNCWFCDFFQKESHWCFRSSCIGCTAPAKPKEHEYVKPTAWSVNEDEHNRRLELYKRGMSDGEIGRVLGKSQSTIFGWRKLNGLKKNDVRTTVPPDEEERRMKAYRAFDTDAKSAEFLGMAKKSFQKWRESRMLPFDRSKYK